MTLLYSYILKLSQFTKILQFINRNNKYNYLVIGFLFCISLLFIAIWFRSMTFIASGEEGVLFYSATRALTISKGIWHEIDLGLSTPLYITRLPLFLIASILEQIGLAGWVIQAIIFEFIVFAGLVFSWKLFSLLLNSYEKKVPFIASIFYLCNLYVMSQVFARFILSLIILWAFLPIFLYYFIQWFQTGKKRFLIFFSIFNLLFSQVYLLVSPVLTLWLSAFIYIMVYEIKKKNFPKLIYKILVFGIFWAFVNVWWIVPFVFSNTSTHASLQNYNLNLTSLIEVSQYFPSIEVLTLRQSYYFGPKGFWSDYYHSTFLAILPHLVLMIVLYGLYNSRKNLSARYFACLFLIGWFLSKGVNSPFGLEVYTFLFKYFPILQAFRNPYEKLGIIFVLSYSVFFSIGLVLFSSYFARIKNILIISMSILVMYVLVRPMWNGNVFRQYNVTVPTYYRDMNEVIKGEGTDDRLLHMPYPVTGDAKLRWAPKVVGINETLFDNPSYPLLALQGNEYFYQTLPHYTGSEYFSNILKITSTCCILLHSDIISDKNYYQDINESRRKIKLWRGVEEKSKIGELELFMLNPEFREKRVYLSSSLVSIQTLEDALNEITSEDFDYKKTAYIVNDQNEVRVADFASKSLPQYDVVKINNTQYVITTKNVIEPFVLVLANNYNSSWTAFVDGNEIKNHFKVNGFGNGWIIDKAGEYDIKIVFDSW